MAHTHSYTLIHILAHAHSYTLIHILAHAHSYTLIHILTHTHTVNPGIGEGCLKTGDCKRVKDAVCSDGQCRCPAGSRYEGNNDECVIR